MGPEDIWQEQFVVLEKRIAAKVAVAEADGDPSAKTWLEAMVMVDRTIQEGFKKMRGQNNAG